MLFFNQFSAGSQERNRGNEPSVKLPAHTRGEPAESGPSCAEAGGYPFSHSPTDVPALSMNGRQKRGDTEGQDNSKYPVPNVLFFNDRFHGTDFSTTPAFSAFLFVDHVGLSLFDRFRRTLFRTCPTGNTFIGNHVRH